MIGNIKKQDEERQLGSQEESRLETFFQNEIWPYIPESLRGTRLTKAEEEAILGYVNMPVGGDFPQTDLELA